MGMAASQVRLLALTDRLHDIELRAQQIQAQKIALATQKDAIYENYCDALEETNYQVAFATSAGTKTYQDATFVNLCTYQEGRYRDYALTNTRTGNIIVSPEMAEAFEDFGDDKYAFAYAMLGLDTNFGSTDLNNRMAKNIGVGANSNAENWQGYGNGENYAGAVPGDVCMTEAEENVFRKIYENSEGDQSLKNAYDNYVTETDPAERAKKLEEFRDMLYSDNNRAAEIFDHTNKNKNGGGGYTYTNDKGEAAKFGDYRSEFNYYIRMWEAIEEAGGCEAIDPQYASGKDGREWLENMVEAGLITIQDNDPKGSRGWEDTSIATSTNGNYLTEVEDDTNLEQAKAEYEYELDIINRKETKMDNELNVLETERTAITTEMDSITKVKDDNIDRTFNLFS